MDAISSPSELTGELLWRELDYLGETLTAVWSQKGLVLLQFHDGDPAGWLRRNFPRAAMRHCPADTTDWLRADSPMVLEGTPFRRRVWDALSQIPVGETRSYRDLAAQLDSAPRAVGQAVAGNRFAVRIPCHRVVPARGGSGQYRWGKDRKARLLAREGAL